MLFHPGNWVGGSVVNLCLFNTSLPLFRVEAASQWLNRQGSGSIPASSQRHTEVMEIKKKKFHSVRPIPVRISDFDQMTLWAFLPVSRWALTVECTAVFPSCAQLHYPGNYVCRFASASAPAPRRTGPAWNVSTHHADIASARREKSNYFTGSSGDSQLMKMEIVM